MTWYDIIYYIILYKTPTEFQPDLNEYNLIKKETKYFNCNYSTYLYNTIIIYLN